MKDLQREDYLLYNDLANKFNDFFNKLDSLKLTPGFFRLSFLNRTKLIVILAYIFQLVFLFPFYVLGIITNYIPYKIPAWIFKALKPDIEYRASIYMFTGMFVFPLFYGLDLFLFRVYITKDIVLSLLFLFSIPFLGFIVMYYWKIFNRFSRVLKFYFKVGGIDKEALIKTRDHLVLQIKRID